MYINQGNTYLYKRVQAFAVEQTHTIPYKKYHRYNIFCLAQFH